MNFYSVTFLLGFAVLFALYYIPSNRAKVWQNSLLLVGSYLFYAYANMRFLPLLIVVTLFYYAIGKAIGNSVSEKKSNFLTTAGVCAALGLLIYFKYLNFFVSSVSSITLHILVPLGISFFLFRLISYVVEIHRGRIEPCNDLLAFATYVSFFPCIVAGPIDRPGFLKQLDNNRAFNYDLTVDGCRQALWGLFKKVAIADNIAPFVNAVWAGDIAGESGLKLILIAFMYSFQMYFDFSGYSDMAIGISKTLGLKVARNFKTPFFALNMADFWRRWHMSLTSWLTDYVFMPLNIKFRSLGQWGMILAIIINFLLVGIWHGDNWTYAAFGLYHGLLFIPLILSGSFMKKVKMKPVRFGLPCLSDFAKMLLTFTLVTIGLVIFRANTIGKAFLYFKTSLNGELDFLFEPRSIVPLFFIAVGMVSEWIQREKEHALDLNGVKNNCIKYLIYIAITVAVITMSTDGSAFIYAQF